MMFMTIFAIAANVAQLLIILAILFIGGLDLGTGVIILLFALISVPFINVLALFFSNRPMAAPAPPEIGGDGLVKREALRVRYPEGHCPVLKTGDIAFAVRDLSEGGVRIRASLSTPFKKKVNCEIQLLSGERLRFKGTLIRREEGEVVFRFADPIGTAPLINEKKAIAAIDDGETNLNMPL